ncbi:YybH family protein [Flavihumibacter sp. UBA7668]|uniref:YybH family protein n=1 Tax=Flavihumibacter sp. UBA7668 TaxID=1946542 RepID=UPI0025C6BE13|nr:nuclear transport factor 2 family protein [Flavihumibacter sp. UBA7668]
MKKLLFAFTLIVSTFLISQTANAQSNQKAEIENLLFAYRDALNASDASKVIALYTTEGVLLANAAPTAEGAAAVIGTYQYVFDNFKYNLDFTIGEIVVNGNYAFARSTSKGSFVINASGQTMPDENRELFVLEKVKGEWKIARYMYNKAK